MATTLCIGSGGGGEDRNDGECAEDCNEAIGGWFHLKSLKNDLSRTETPRALCNELRPIKLTANERQAYRKLQSLFAWHDETH